MVNILEISQICGTDETAVRFLQREGLLLDPDRVNNSQIMTANGMKKLSIRFTLGLNKLLF